MQRLFLDSNSMSGVSPAGKGFLPHFDSDHVNSLN